MPDDSSQSRPEQVHPAREAQGTDEEHPDPGYDVDAAFGERSYTALLAPAPAHQGVDAEREAGYPDDDEENS